MEILIKALVFAVLFVLLRPLVSKAFDAVMGKGANDGKP